MGYFLFDNPNPHGDHFYRQALVDKIACVIHITAGLQDLDGVGDDISAEATARYAATTDRDVSWHSGSDTNSYLYLLPPKAVAWHVVNYNGPTYGHEISKGATDWRVMPGWWVEQTLRQAAACLRPVLRELGIPIRKATKAEVDHAIRTGGGPVGLISHAELQPSDRTDPGWVGGVDTFPWARFLELLRGDEPPKQEDDDMPVLIKGKSSTAVYSVSSTAEGYFRRHIGQSEFLVLTAAGVKTTTVNQWDVDQIPVWRSSGPSGPVLLVKGEKSPAVYSITSTAEGFFRRHIDGSEYAVLAACGVPVATVAQADVDKIPDFPKPDAPAA